MKKAKVRQSELVEMDWTNLLIIMLWPLVALLAFKRYESSKIRFIFFVFAAAGGYAVWKSVYALIIQSYFFSVLWIMAYIPGVALTGITIRVLAQQEEGSQSWLKILRRAKID